MLTDYPDTALLENLQYNVDFNLSRNPGSKVFVKVFVSLTYFFAVLLIKVGIYLGKASYPPA